jgi:hypothetical protein
VPGEHRRLSTDWLRLGALEVFRPSTYGLQMLTSGFKTQPVPRHSPETDAERLSRNEREEAIIAKAEADIDALDHDENRQSE